MRLFSDFPRTPLTACLLIASPALAEGPNRLSILTGSHHLNASAGFEEVNPGLFADWVGSDGVTWSIGAYRNSYGRVSVAGMAGLELYSKGRTRVDLFAGLANYPEDGRKTQFSSGDIIPLAGVRVSHGNVFVLAIPGDGEVTDGIFGFGFSYGIEN